MRKRQQRIETLENKNRKLRLEIEQLFVASNQLQNQSGVEIAQIRLNAQRDKDELIRRYCAMEKETKMLANEKRGIEVELGIVKQQTNQALNENSTANQLLKENQLQLVEALQTSKIETEKTKTLLTELAVLRHTIAVLVDKINSLEAQNAESALHLEKRTIPVAGMFYQSILEYDQQSCRSETDIPPMLMSSNQAQSARESIDASDKRQDDQRVGNEEMGSVERSAMNVSWKAMNSF